LLFKKSIMIKRVQLTTREGKKVTGRQVIVTSDFGTNIENIWCKIQDIDTLREICKPKASFISCDDSPLIWEEGRSFLFKMYLHKVIPIGKHTINVVKMDRVSREIDTNEYNKRVPIWNHYIKMEEISKNVTRYTDIVDLYAGLFTSLAAWWTLRFYKHRQRKWQKIAKMM